MMIRILSCCATILLSLFLFSTAEWAAANPYRDFVEKRLAARFGVQTPDGMARIASPRIVNGSEAGASEHRFQVALLFAEVSSNFGAFYCGGSLYRGRFVITAAHCSDFVTAQSVRVLVGARKLDGSGKRYKVKAIYVHPKWDPFSFDYDIAVWCLEEEVPDAPKLYLPRRDPAVGTMMKVSGWGALGDPGTYPLALQIARVPIVGRNNCNDGNSYKGDITKRMICAGFDGGEIDSCFGDSGGPLTKPRPEGGRVLSGIVSWGESCALPNKFGVYTRVSHHSIRNFIAKVTWPWPLVLE